jgi:hypothetical protein
MSTSVPGRAVGRWYFLVILATPQLLAVIDRFALSSFIQPLQTELGVSDVQAGLLMGPAFSIFMHWRRSLSRGGRTKAIVASWLSLR